MAGQKTTIRVNSLSGGVARQAPSKRLPTETEQADNVMLSLERSAEKRHGSEHVAGEGPFQTLNIIDDSDDLVYYYLDIDGVNRQLIVLNPDALSVEQVVQVFNAETGIRETATSLSTSLSLNPSFQTYLQAGTGTAKEKLRFVEIQGNLLILNTQVEAKFLTTGDGAAITYTDPATGIPVRNLNQQVDPNGVLQDIGVNRKNYSQLRLPPDASDPIKGNGAESEVGTGLVWYARESYLDTPGQAFYKADSASQQPWYLPVRTEQAGSLLDGDTWPWLLEYDRATDDFAVGQPRWTPRYSGTRANNPGPSPIANSSDPFGVTPTGARLTAAAYFRNRLWFSSGSTVFSSQLDDPFNLWIADPSEIVDTDPIDITASSGKNADIAWMVPYSDFMLITTVGATQYELQGSQNFISPSTAALEPTSFYGTDKFTEPTKVGSLLYFADRGRLFMYLGSSGNDVQQAMNISENVWGYFPQDVPYLVPAPNQNSIFALDANDGRMAYVYTARYNGSQQTQNAFYRWVFQNESAIKYAYVIGSYLYLLNRRPTQLDVDGETVLDRGTYLERVYLERTVPSDVMLDRKVTSTGTTSGADTLFPIPWLPSPGEDVVCWHNNEQLSGLVEGSGGSYWFRALNVSLAGQTAVVGETYLMDVTLSTPVQRDQYNNYVDGRLMLKDINVRHYNTGRYDVVVKRWNRNPDIFSFDPLRSNSPLALGPQSYFEVEGAFSPRIQAWDARSSISLQSIYPTPVNLTNVEFRGDFAPSLSSSVTQ